MLFGDVAQRGILDFDGPATVTMDCASSGPIPWSDQASTHNRSVAVTAAGVEQFRHRILGLAVGAGHADVDVDVEITEREFVRP